MRHLGEHSGDDFIASRRLCESFGTLCVSLIIPTIRTDFRTNRRFVLLLHEWMFVVFWTLCLRYVPHRFPALSVFSLSFYVSFLYPMFFPSIYHSLRTCHILFLFYLSYLLSFTSLFRVLSSFLPLPVSIRCFIYFLAFCCSHFPWYLHSPDQLRLNETLPLKCPASVNSKAPGYDVGLDTTPSHFKIRFNIINLLFLRSPKWSLPNKF